MPKKEKLCPQLKVNEQPLVPRVAKAQKTVSKNTTVAITGWVNIQKVPNGGMFTGADIHETEELAKKHASANTITQTRIEFTVK